MRPPITIRWTKAVEQVARTKANTMRNKLVATLLHENTKLKAILHRWGLDHGIYGQGASQTSKPPKGVGVSI